jgi:uncharacterized protein (TIGR02594 family)
MMTVDGYTCLSLFTRAQRFIGVTEITGSLDHPMIMAWLKLTGENTWDGWPDHDEVAWCSAAMNGWCWDLRLPRSKSLRARSWLGVGRPILLHEAEAKNDVLIFKRAGDNEPGPEDLTAPGHCGVFAGYDGGDYIQSLGGNQSNKVCIAPYAKERLLGIRRLLG